MELFKLTVVSGNPETKTIIEITTTYFLVNNKKQLNDFCDNKWHDWWVDNYSQLVYGFSGENLTHRFNSKSLAKINKEDKEDFIKILKLNTVVDLT